MHEPAKAIRLRSRQSTCVASRRVIWYRVLVCLCHVERSRASLIVERTTVRDSSTSLGMTRTVTRTMNGATRRHFIKLSAATAGAFDLGLKIDNAVRRAIREATSHSHSWRHRIHRALSSSLRAQSRTQSHDIQPRQDASGRIAKGSRTTRLAIATANWMH